VEIAIVSREAERAVLNAMLVAGRRERRRQRLALAGVPARRVDDVLEVVERMTRTPSPPGR